MESLEFFTEPVMGIEFSVKMVDGRYNVYDYSRDNETGKKIDERKNKK